MKRLVCSVILGGLLTALLWVVILIPTSGPTPLTVFVVLAFQTPTKLITKDRELGEFVFYGIQVLFFSVVSYGILAAVKSLRQPKQEHASDNQSAS